MQILHKFKLKEKDMPIFSGYYVVIYLHYEKQTIHSAGSVRERFRCATFNNNYCGVGGRGRCVLLLFEE